MIAFDHKSIELAARAAHAAPAAIVRKGAILGFQIHSRERSKARFAEEYLAHGGIVIAGGSETKDF